MTGMHSSSTMNYSQSPDEILKAHSYRLLRKKAIRNTIIFLLMFIVILALSLSSFAIARVSRTSMEPTLNSGDMVLIKKIWNHYMVGDIVVYETYTDHKNVKRIVAVNGDIVDLSSDGCLTVNGIIQKEAYVYRDMNEESTGVNFPITVEEGKVFLLGDNRASSIDSRDTGTVSLESIVGKVITKITFT